MEAALLQYGLPGIVILGLGMALVALWKSNQAKDAAMLAYMERAHAERLKDLKDVIDPVRAAIVDITRTVAAMSRSAAKDREGAKHGPDDASKR